MLSVEAFLQKPSSLRVRIFMKVLTFAKEPLLICSTTSDLLVKKPHSPGPTLIVALLASSCFLLSRQVVALCLTQTT